MTNIKISELVPMSLAHTVDFFPIVDSGSLTTERVSISVLNTWFTNSGSCLTASYALSAPTGSSLWTSNGININNTNAGYVGVNNTTPQYQLDVNGSINASQNLTVTNSISASSILASNYILANTLNIAIASTGSDWQSWAGYPLTSSNGNAIWFNSGYGYNSPSSDFVKILYVDDNGDSGKLIVVVGDNTPIAGSSGDYTLIGPKIDTLYHGASGVLYGVAGGGSGGSSLHTASALFINTDTGVTYGRRLTADKFTAHDQNSNAEATYGTSSYAASYTSSIVNGIGFLGTASYAVTASYVLNQTSSGVSSTKAWVQFVGFYSSSNSVLHGATTGNCKILSSYNISSVFRSATGVYTLNFPNGAITNTNYTIIGGGIKQTDGTGAVITEQWSSMYPTQTAADVKTTSQLKIRSITESDEGSSNNVDGIISLSVVG